MIYLCALKPSLSIISIFIDNKQIRYTYYFCPFYFHALLLFLLSLSHYAKDHHPTSNNNCQDRPKDRDVRSTGRRAPGCRHLKKCRREGGVEWSPQWPWRDVYSECYTLLQSTFSITCSGDNVLHDLYKNTAGCPLRAELAPSFHPNKMNILSVIFLSTYVQDGGLYTKKHIQCTSRKVKWVIKGNVFLLSSLGNYGWQTARYLGVMHVTCVTYKLQLLSAIIVVSYNRAFLLSQFTKKKKRFDLLC